MVVVARTLRWPLLLALVCFVAWPSMALAQTATGAPASIVPTPTATSVDGASLGPARTAGAAEQVVLSGTVLVPKGVTVGEIVLFHGRAQIAGAVDGDVVVLDGPVAIAGAYITGSVVALNGPIRVTGAARIGGDVLGADRVTVDPGAELGGDVRQHVGFTLQGPLAALGVLLGGAAISFSVLLLGLVLLLIAPRGADRVATTMAARPLASFGWGLVVTIAVPVVCVAVMATILGLPLGLAGLLAVALLFLLGLTWTAWGIGRSVVRAPRSRVLAFLAGWGIVTVVGFVPFVDLAMWALGSVLGVGAMAVAAWQARAGGPGRHRAGSLAPPDAASGDGRTERANRAGLGTAHPATTD